MPFSSNQELPSSVKDNLPSAAQTVFRTVANRELEQGASEESAFRQAWTAVKNGWEKNAEGNWVKKGMSEITIVSDVCKVDGSLGLVFGYAMVCKIDGEPHFDLQGHHIPEETMLKTLTKFMENSNIAKEMHTGEQVGKYLFAFPMTTDIAKALDIQVKQTGALIAMKPDNQSTLEKFKSGEFTGFSIGGVNAVFEDVPDA